MAHGGCAGGRTDHRPAKERPQRRRRYGRAGKHPDPGGPGWPGCLRHCPHAAHAQVTAQTLPGGQALQPCRPTISANRATTPKSPLRACGVMAGTALQGTVRSQGRWPVRLGDRATPRLRTGQPKLHRAVAATDHSDLTDGHGVHRCSPGPPGEGRDLARGYLPSCRYYEQHRDSRPRRRASAAARLGGRRYGQQPAVAGSTTWPSVR